MAIPDDILIKAAKKAMANAYSPYSKFAVGAALYTADGEIVLGCNVENASYGLTNCAERTAIFSAIAQGKRHFNKLAIIGDTQGPISPCGACRQVIAEFCSPNMPVILTNLNGDTKYMSVKELLPYAFTPLDLND